MVDYLLLELIGKSWKALTVTAAVGTSHSMGQTSEKGLTGPRGQLQCLIVDQGCGSLVIVAVKKRLIRKLEKLPWLSHLFCSLSQFWRCRCSKESEFYGWFWSLFYLPRRPFESGFITIIKENTKNLPIFHTDFLKFKISFCQIFTLSWIQFLSAFFLVLFWLF